MKGKSMKGMRMIRTYLPSISLNDLISTFDVSKSDKVFIDDKAIKDPKKKYPIQEERLFKIGKQEIYVRQI
jgi:hypothetical protein